MKATINGIQVEGTPEEIKKYQELVVVQAQPLNPCDPPYNPYGSGGTGNPIKIPVPSVYPIVTYGSGMVSCPEWMKDLQTWN